MNLYKRLPAKLLIALKNDKLIAIGDRIVQNARDRDAITKIELELERRR